MDIIQYIENEDFFSGSDTGLVRKANEDSCGTAETPNGYLFTVCDGMGGHVGGATASKIAVESITHYFSKEIYKDIKKALHDALCFANTQILGKAAENQELKGMGTTACILLIQDDKAWFAHVGDSRIYIFTNKKLRRITQDHSYVQGLVNQGIISDSEAESHPDKNKILKALGNKIELSPEVCKEPIIPSKNDIILICSDGLNGMVNDETIASALASKSNIQQKGEQLIERAKQAGGTDNITVQLIQTSSAKNKNAIFIDKNPISEKTQPRIQKSQLKILAIILVIFACGIIGGFFLGREKPNIINFKDKTNKSDSIPHETVKIDSSKIVSKQQNLNDSNRKDSLNIEEKNKVDSVLNDTTNNKQTHLTNE